MPREPPLAQNKKNKLIPENIQNIKKHAPEGIWHNNAKVNKKLITCICEICDYDKKYGEITVSNI